LIYTWFTFPLQGTKSKNRIEEFYNSCKIAFSIKRNQSIGKQFFEIKNRGERGDDFSHQITGEF